MINDEIMKEFYKDPPKKTFSYHYIQWRETLLYYVNKLFGGKL